MDANTKVTTCPIIEGTHIRFFHKNTLKPFPIGVKCSLCGEHLSHEALEARAIDDTDPSFTLEEKMFQQANFWLAGEDEGAHWCKVIARL